MVELTQEVLTRIFSVLEMARYFLGAFFPPHFLFSSLPLLSSLPCCPSFFPSFLLS